MQKTLIITYQTAGTHKMLPVVGLEKSEFWEWFLEICQKKYPVPNRSYYIGELGIECAPEEITWDGIKEVDSAVYLRRDTGIKERGEMPFFGDGSFIK